MERDAHRMKLMNRALDLQCRALFMHQHLVPYVASVKEPHPVSVFIMGVAICRAALHIGRHTLAYLQSRDEPIKALGSSHMTK